ncbi:MAG: DUF4129 domain-containing protein, partial [Archangium sp.]|nr:DUF4129 domain-containing protein [Archangium sp.]
EVREILAADGTGDLGAALAANPAGWLASVAFIRGVAHARLPADPRRIATVLAAGIPGLAVLALLGGMVTEPWRSQFLADAQVQVTVFLAAAVPALALARLTLVGPAAAVDWRRNPAWLGLVAALLVGAATIATWLSVVAGPSISTVLGVVFVPLLLAGLVAGFDRRAVGILLISVFGAAVLAASIQLFGAVGGVDPGAAGGVADTGSDPETGTQVALGVLGLVLLLAIGAVLVLARLWLRRSPAASPDGDETRVIDHGGEGSGRPRRRRGRTLFGRRTTPHDAVAAYRALLEDLEDQPAVRRVAGETPAEHARRLRGEGTGALGLDLLAADYGLARYGGVRLSLAEERRAVARWSSMRRRLRAAAGRGGS